MLKVDRLETHDRYLEFMKPTKEIGQHVQMIIESEPFGNRPFYMFGHPRTLDLTDRWKLFCNGKYSNFADVPTHKIMWQARLLKPKAETNSWLFRCYPRSDRLDLVWNIPKPETWDQFDLGKMTEDDTTLVSIYNYIHCKELLDEPHPDDPSDAEAREIYRQIAMNLPKRQPRKII
ncbi:MAG: hypothetical protein KGI54_09480 [Pseudomonadota bacterium]|nr:hypothetical protein [Pseudomonadota bacterium]